MEFPRYYKGEKRTPYRDQDEAILWSYEKAWSDAMRTDYLFEDELAEYVTHELTQFCDDDGVSVTYKAMLFNRYAQSFQSMQEAVEPFKAFYMKYYRE